MTITVSDASALDITGSISIEVWAKLFPFTETVHGLLGKDNAYGMGVGQSGSNLGFVGKVGNGSSIQYTLEDTQVWIDGTWHHFAFTFVDNSRARLYVDGTQVVEDTNVSDSLGTNGQDLEFANWSGQGWGFKGVIDEIRLWNDERTASEIQNNLYTGLSGGEANLVGYWPFKNASGSTITDETANNNDGSLSGGQWVHRDTDNASFFFTPDGQPDIGLSQSQAPTLDNSGVYTEEDGVTRGFLDINVKPLQRRAKYQELVYRRSVGSNEWTVAEKLNNDTTKTVRIDNLSINTNYDVAVRSFSAVSSDTDIVFIGSNPITTSASNAPSNVLNLSATQYRDHVEVTWDPLSETDIDEYQIRATDSGQSWSNADIIGSAPRNDDRKFIFLKPGTWTVYIKAVTKSGQFSGNEDSDTVTVEAPKEVFEGSGSFNYTVPNGVSEVIADQHAAGGGGGAGGEGEAADGTKGGEGGKGGNAGESKTGQTLSVTGGETLTINHGSKGSGGTAPSDNSPSDDGNPGGDAGDSNIKDSGSNTLLSTTGGTGGAGGTGGGSSDADGTAGTDGEDSVLGKGGAGGAGDVDSTPSTDEAEAGGDGEVAAGGGGGGGGSENDFENNKPGGDGGPARTTIEFK